MNLMIFYDEFFKRCDWSKASGIRNPKRCDWPIASGIRIMPVGSDRVWDPMNNSIWAKSFRFYCLGWYNNFDLKVMKYIKQH